VTFGFGAARGSVIIAMTLMVFCALYWMIDLPIDNWRHGRFAAKQTAMPKIADQPIKT
jgi:hypothetical protein